MSYLPAETRIARHVEKLRAHSSSKVDGVLARCGFFMVGSEVRSRNGEVTDESCYLYKQAIRETFGEVAYTFAKVNFMLSGCRCPDCR